MLLTSPGLPPQHAIPLPAATSNPTSGASTPAGQSSEKKQPMMMPIHSPHQANAMRNMHQHMSPTVYEMAALTQDLDTQVITTKIKEALLTNNIGQKIFGEAVLGLSQGSVSELLSKPKPWHMLSIKGREPFIRMQLWLSDANNVDRLQALKNERREASKRRRSTGPNQQDNSSDTSSNDTNDFYTSSPGPGSVGSAGAPPNKKQRVLFSEEQKEALRLAFALDPYPNVGTIEFLANELNLATRTITNWFHNHRMRLKQQVPHGPPGQETNIPTRENTNSTPFDPVQFRILLQQRLLELQKERMGLGGNNPLPYPPYFAAAALLGRSLAGMPGAAGGAAPNEAELRALNQKFQEQMAGLDLSMSSLKRERSDDFDDDLDDGHMSENENDSLDGETEKSGEFKALSNHAQQFLNNMRLNRRKPAAPQWVNPAVPSGQAAGQSGESATERLLNGEESSTSHHHHQQQHEEDMEQNQREEEAGDAPHHLVMEPEVLIKQEKEDCESDSLKEANEGMARSQDEDVASASVTSAAAAAVTNASAWNY
uniref:One cut domain family member n=1 Tax=Musca domestica TaxID=7370 RepID=T1PJE1_MUSDO